VAPRRKGRQEAKENGDEEEDVEEEDVEEEDVEEEDEEEGRMAARRRVHPSCPTPDCQEKP